MRTSFLIAFAVIILFSGAHMQAVSLLPENLDLPGYLATALTHVYEQSGTFRTQCDRLGRARNVHVRVSFDFNMRCACRAFTIISSRRGMMRAEIHVAPGGALPELVAHEFEHVLEQMENLDLRTLARVRGSGVYQVEADRFETERAAQAGRIVLAEVRGHRGAALPDGQIVDLSSIHPSMAGLVPAPAPSLAP